MAVSDDTRLFGVRVERFRLIDYYTTPWIDEVYTPRPVLVATRDLVTGRETVFAWHLFAEARRIPSHQIPARQAELERLLLRALRDHMSENPKTWWLHWGLRSLTYGFPALAQRAKALGLGVLLFPERRMIDIAALFKNRLGDDYVPHNRLPNLIRLNHINDAGMLGHPELTAAFRAGDYRSMMHSLQRKLSCLARIIELGAKGNLQPPAAANVIQSPARGTGKATWLTCARSVLGDSRHRRGRRSGPAVVLRGPGDPPVVQGKTKARLTKAQYDAVKALLDAGETGLTKDSLDANSGHGDTRKVLKRLAARDGDWREVIHFPGATGRGYRIG